MAEGPVGWPGGVQGLPHRFHTAPVMSPLCFLHPRGVGVVIPILWMRALRLQVLRGFLMPTVACPRERGQTPGSPLRPLSLHASSAEPQFVPLRNGTSPSRLW